MDIHCRDCPNFKIKIEYQNRSFEHIVDSFYKNKEEMLNEFIPSISLKEFQTFYLFFDSDDKNSKLYMDGLEFLPSGSVKYGDDNNVFLPPSKNYYPIYLYDKGYYPFRVGIYEICIEENNNKYYCLLQIEPIHINDEELIFLREDLEKELMGLSQDLIRKNIGFGSAEFSSLPIDLLQKFFIINTHADELIGALIDLKDKPNFRIEKCYIRNELYKARKIDNITIRDYLRRGVEDEKYLLPQRVVSYDLQENRWLKKIITEYEANLNDFLKIVTDSKQLILREIEALRKYRYSTTEITIKKNLLKQLKLYEVTAKRILTISNIVKSQEWYGQITQLKDGFIPHVLVMDARYGVLYSLFNDLKEQKFEINIDKNYSYTWKNTSKLYELWCFIKVYKMLLLDKFSFSNTNGFITTKTKSLLIPMIMSGTYIELEKNNVVLKLYYDKIIHSMSKLTDRINEPLYTNGHNRPDARLDIYVDGLYIRSIIFEFKYRAIDSFWKKSNTTTSYRQIVSYKDNTKSNYIENYDIKKSKDIRPVKEVWVIHPSYDNKNEQTIEKYDEGVKLIRMRPGENIDEIIDNLHDAIEEIITSVDEKIKVSEENNYEFVQCVSNKGLQN